MEDEIEDGKQLKNETPEDVPPPPPSANMVENAGVLEYMECRGKKIREVWK